MRELLIISQTTSAYGLDVRYRTDFWDGRPLRTDIQTLAHTLTDQGFGDLLGFLRTARHDRVRFFTCSPVDGVVANALSDPLPDASKQERFDRFMEVQSEISLEKLGGPHR